MNIPSYEIDEHGELISSRFEYEKPVPSGKSYINNAAQLTNR